jgi:hypothetical protein
MSSIGRITDAIPTDIDLSDAEREAVIEIALLAIAADRTINDDELLALRRIAHKLGGARIADRAEASVDALLERGIVARDEAEARLRELASWLTTPGARAIAYKVAYALALADLASADQEFEFDLQLIDALGLSQELVDGYVAEVVSAVSPGS